VFGLFHGRFTQLNRAMVAVYSSASLLLRQLKKINLELTLSGPKHCVIKVKCADITWISRLGLPRGAADDSSSSGSVHFH
jgi:hypothetical protein